MLCGEKLKIKCQNKGTFKKIFNLCLIKEKNLNDNGNICDTNLDSFAKLTQITAVLHVVFKTIGNRVRLPLLDSFYPVLP